MLQQEKLAILTFLAIVASVYALALAVVVRSALAYIGKGKVRNGRFQVWYRRVILSLAALGFLCILYGRFVEPFWLSVRAVEVKSFKLPPGTQPIRLVHISDIHSDRTARLEDRLPSAIAALKPDLIAFTGDSLNSAEGLPVFRKCIAEISTIAPTFVVKGNWDAWFWYNQDLFGGTGANELKEGPARVEIRGTPVWLAGVPVGREKVIDEVLQGVTPGELSIFLYHYPDEVERAAVQGVDLYLAGHTHGGQIAVPFYGALVTLSKFGKKYEAGTYRIGNTTLNVNRGIGMEGGPAPRVRFYARPEITVIDIVPDK